MKFLLHHIINAVNNLYSVWIIMKPAWSWQRAQEVSSYISEADHSRDKSHIILCNIWHGIHINIPAPA